MAGQPLTLAIYGLPSIGSCGQFYCPVDKIPGSQSPGRDPNLGREAIYVGSENLPKNISKNDSSFHLQCANVPQTSRNQEDTVYELQFVLFHSPWVAASS